MKIDFKENCVSAGPLVFCQATFEDVKLLVQKCPSLREAPSKVTATVHCSGRGGERSIGGKNEYHQSFIHRRKGLGKPLRIQLTKKIGGWGPFEKYEETQWDNLGCIPVYFECCCIVFV